MESLIRWIHSGSRGVKISFLQGFFESAGELDPVRRSMIAPVLPDYVEDIMRIFKDLNIQVSIVDADPVTISVSLKEAIKIPLLNPAIKNGKYYDLRSLKLTR